MAKEKVKTIKGLPKLLPRFGGGSPFRGPGLDVPKAGNQIKVGAPRITQHKGGGGA